MNRRRTCVVPDLQACGTGGPHAGGHVVGEAHGGRVDATAGEGHGTRVGVEAEHHGAVAGRALQRQLTVREARRVVLHTTQGTQRGIGLVSVVY